MALPQSLVLGGGGIRVIAYYGVLRQLESAGKLATIKNFYGVSAGALVCVLLAAGYTIEELGKLLRSMDFFAFQNISADLILNILDELGADKGHQMHSKVHEFLTAKGMAPTITFAQLADLTGNQLHIYATNLNTVSLVHLSAETTPNMEIAHALRISMSVPGWLTPIRQPDATCVLVDGGMSNNYPFDCIPAEKRGSAIGITFSPVASSCEKIETIGQYIEQIVTCATLPRAARNIRRFSDKTILIDIDRFPTFKFDLSEEEKDWLVARGTAAADVYLSKKN